ncbi:MAG: replication protein [Chloroflexi bacterium]|nr:replication protein [Chloroflexota bacterium]
MTIAPPNYTQTPNEILDLLCEMSEAEMRVTLAICRETFGWHRPTAKLSISDLELLTGLSRQGVLNGLAAGADRGTIQREAVGNGYSYHIVVVNEVDQNSQRSRPVNKVDQSTTLTTNSQRSRPKMVNEVDQPFNSIKEKRKLKKILSTSTAAEPIESRQRASGDANKNKNQQSTTYRLLRDRKVWSASNYAHEPVAVIQAYLDHVGSDYPAAQIAKDLEAGVHQRLAQPPAVEPTHPDEPLPNWPTWLPADHGLPPDMAPWMRDAVWVADRGEIEIPKHNDRFRRRFSYWLTPLESQLRGLYATI